MDFYDVKEKVIEGGQFIFAFVMAIVLFPFILLALSIIVPSMFIYIGVKFKVWVSPRELSHFITNFSLLFQRGIF